MDILAANIQAYVVQLFESNCTVFVACLFVCIVKILPTILFLFPSRVPNRSIWYQIQNSYSVRMGRWFVDEISLSQHLTIMNCWIEFHTNRKWSLHRGGHKTVLRLKVGNELAEGADVVQRRQMHPLSCNNKDIFGRTEDRCFRWLVDACHKDSCWLMGKEQRRC